MYSVNIPEPRLRNGAYFYELLLTDTTSHLTTATINDKEKLVFADSKFSINLITDSWKYGTELQFTAFSRKAPVLKHRTDKEHDYYRLECGYLPGDHETADKLREMADMIDAIVGYSPVTFQVDPRPPLKVLDKDFRLEDVLI
jgi:hypothetical protein